MAHSTLRKLVSELKSSYHFGSMMLDETADISCSEQISVCFRKMTEKFEVENGFLGSINPRARKVQRFIPVLLIAIAVLI